MEALFKYLGRDLIRGLGIGFLVSAMLILAYPEEKTQLTPLTDEEIIIKAKELGMIEKKDIKNISSTVEKVPSNQQTKVDSSLSVTKKPIKIVIPKGSNLSDIAEILYKSGAISDKKKFISLVEKLKLATKFHTGTYIIPANAETLDIITLMSK